MATRSLIRLLITNSYCENNKTLKSTDKVELYKHWDGSPEATVPLITEFFKESKFGFDTHLNSVSQVAHALIVYAALHGIRVEPLGINTETNEINGIHGLEYEYNIKIDSTKDTAVLEVIDCYKKYRVIDEVNLKLGKRGSEDFELIEWAGLRQEIEKWQR